MRVVGTRRIPVADINGMDDIDELMKTTRVQELAASIKDVGGRTINDPVVRSEGNRIVCGRDRIAAYTINGANMISVRLIVCTDTEADVMTRHENVYRRIDPAQRDQDLSDLVKLKLDQKIAAHPDKKVAGQGGLLPEARKEVAKETGHTTEQVRMSEARAKRRDKGAHAQPADIQTWGIEVDERWSKGFGGTQEYMKTAAKRLRNAREELNVFSESGCPIQRNSTAKLREDIRRLARLASTMVPVALCPYCKGQDGVQADCVGCEASGFMTSR